MLDYRNILIVISVIAFLLFFFSKKIRRSERWQAIVTPLASIIGSGFLVSAPLLMITAGRWSYLVISIICIIAYMLGSAVRFNIFHLEPLLKSNAKKEFVGFIESIAKPFLGIAYLISVTFYLKLLSAFFFRGIGVENIIFEESLTTMILLLIGIYGWIYGLSSLEKLEEFSVNIKLSIIFALILGSIAFNLHLWMENKWIITSESHFSEIQSLRKILGILIIVQGFETSRYLGELYSKKMRSTTMKAAQLISGIIYISFISLSMVMFNHIEGVSEVAVIQICRLIAPVLPFLLIVAAIMSQFSAAVADTLGGAGLISEATKNFITMKRGILLITLFAIALTWSTSIYGIITIASRAFAFYYATQCLIALILVFKVPHKDIYIKLGRTLLFFTLLLLMIAVMLFGIPAE